MFTEDEWEEWLRWRREWPNPEAEEPPCEDEPASKKAGKAKKTKEKMEDSKDNKKDEKIKKKRKPSETKGAANSGEHEDGNGTATFARRYQPAREFEAVRWQALRDHFREHVRPLCSTPSSFEVG